MMKEEFENHFKTKYPKMVNDNFWGFECGDGWFTLIDKLCSNIQHHIDWKAKQDHHIQQVTLDQVKEKFGTLRFYHTGGDEYIDGMITIAEDISGSICELCGSAGTTAGPGWIKTLCPTHKAEADARYQERL
jgi:hypothetical protein